jgi:octaprenyl-diphosphate synthase
MPIHHVRSLVQSDFEAMNHMMLSMVQDQIGLIDDLASHVMQSGGKRLRPLVVLLSSLACGYQGKQHISLAAMIEFFHTATLLHDDVVDESTLRRGRQTANTIWGSKASILVGDYLFTIYLKLMLQVGHVDIMHLLANITHQVTCGEIKQLAHRNQAKLSIDDYFDVIRSKT